MSTTVLTVSVLLLPAVWGWLTETVLRRVWPRSPSPPAPTPPSSRPALPGAGAASVDFQI
ncbi:MAG: hypothetical protein JNG89_08660 [Planctomycetaceae bacterium]|nr:hypothetical protein [Planctomycetaceae bacterium]